MFVVKSNETQVILFIHLLIFNEEKQNAFLILRKLMNADDKTLIGIPNNQLEAVDKDKKI